MNVTGDGDDWLGICQTGSAQSPIDLSRSNGAFHSAHSVTPEPRQGSFRLSHVSSTALEHIPENLLACASACVSGRPPHLQWAGQLLVYPWAPALKSSSAFEIDQRHVAAALHVLQSLSMRVGVVMCGTCEESFDRTHAPDILVVLCSLQPATHSEPQAADQLWQHRGRWQCRAAPGGR